LSKQQNQTEFFSPFAHIPGTYEWCRIHSPSHGSFDTFIVIETTTDKPVTVYVNDDRGEAFMADRYPESRCIRLDKEQLHLSSSMEGRQINGWLRAEEGPIREASMQFVCSEEALPQETRYGGSDFAVWGSQWTCSGVDLEIPARVDGRVLRESEEMVFRNEAAIITAGSYGLIEKRKG